MTSRQQALIISPTDLEKRVSVIVTMDRIRSLDNSLRIQDSRHELSKNPHVPPSTWDPYRYPTVLGKDPKIINQKVSSKIPSRPLSPPLQARRLNQPAVQRVQSQNEGSRFSSSSFSSASSRASSAAYSSCFSMDSGSGRSSSTAESFYSGRTIDSSPERDAISWSVGNRKPPPVTYGKSPLYENSFENEESKRQVIVRNINGREAFSHRQQVEHDLAKERRQRKRDRDKKQGKALPRLGENKKLPVAQVQSDLPSTQASSDVEYSSAFQFYEETSQSTRTSYKSCPSHFQETPDILAHEAGGRSITTRSNTWSQTGLTSSEDATDWEEDSDLEDSSKISEYPSPTPLERLPEMGLFRLQTELSPMKSRLIEKLMLDIWKIFSNSWLSGMRQHGSSGQSTVSTTDIESGATSRDSSSVRYGKRGQSGDGEDEESGDHHERRRKRAPVDKLPSVREDDPLAANFACPFRKHDPRKYSIQRWPRCAEKSQKTIARLKAHLYQYHLIEQCPPCKSVFEFEEALGAHNMSQDRCEAKTGEQIDGMTRKMKDQIQYRKKPHPGQTDVEKWASRA
ncbi:uncharacterized protein BP5553_07606 [Venustampulla echinocandica]|uniref:C2H2-type domain-containing protein n=1 Tax=Venustampulla echinocandica TaxID=2656787 RepID=A0A370TH02_9HELO|nr:uncharacterized protein BP5553_07606 [Venustampulla echinocandica]RDL34478.1 hypothetical protein BP5553_07606 [Venustampulla echinocandica]